MIDTITDKIIHQLNELPLTKKKAILELIKENSSLSAGKYKTFKDLWRQELLKTSVWSNDEIDEIYKARKYINQWNPEQFF